MPITRIRRLNASPSRRCVAGACSRSQRSPSPLNIRRSSARTIAGASTSPSAVWMRSCAVKRHCAFRRSYSGNAIMTTLASPKVSMQRPLRVTITGSIFSNQLMPNDHVLCRLRLDLDHSLSDEVLRPTFVNFESSETAREHQSPRRYQALPTCPRSGTAAPLRRLKQTRQCRTKS